MLTCVLPEHKNRYSETTAAKMSRRMNSRKNNMFSSQQVKVDGNVQAWLDFLFSIFATFWFVRIVKAQVEFSGNYSNQASFSVPEQHGSAATSQPPSDELITFCSRFSSSPKNTLFTFKNQVIWGGALLQVYWARSRSAAGSDESWCSNWFVNSLNNRWSVCGEMIHTWRETVSVISWLGFSSVQHVLSEMNEEQPLPLFALLRQLVFRDLCKINNNSVHFICCREAKPGSGWIKAFKSPTGRNT